ncbi:hypothetical protein B566_EDAN003003 [Ephemera danica]|nr:hypothetical protein B566_EDAN003003 [Ephemera danica]
MFKRAFMTIISRCNQQFYYHRSLVTKVKAVSNALPNPAKNGPFLYLWIPTVITVHAFGWSKQKSPNFVHLDKLFDENKFSDIRQELAPYKDTGDAEVLWRLARAIFKLSQATTNDKERQELTIEALGYAEKALELGPNISPVHKWYSILLDAKALMDGIKARITVTEKVKHHMMRAVELNPKDATTLYMLGLCLNLLLMGKLYDKMGQRDKAIGFIKRARDYPATTDDDRKANKEASDILKSWGV